jgi:hypothetical protein
MACVLRLLTVSQVTMMQSATVRDEFLSFSCLAFPVVPWLSKKILCYYSNPGGLLLDQTQFSEGQSKWEFKQ